MNQDLANTKEVVLLPFYPSYPLKKKRRVGAQFNCWIGGCYYSQKFIADSIEQLKQEAKSFLEENTLTGETSSGELICRGKVIYSPHFSRKRAK